MASTYSTNLALELIGTGDQAGSWGNTTNTNLGTLVEQAISGYVTQAMTTGNTTTITIPNGATGVARNMYIEMTGTGGTNTVLEVPSNKKLYFIYNNTTGAVTVRVSGQTGVSVAAGTKVILVSNGTDIVNATSYVTGAGTVTSVGVSGGTTGLTTSGGPITSSGTITLAGTLGIANGGTGQTTQQAALNALAGATTNRYFLRGDGTNVSMAAIQAADVPTLNQNTTGTAAGLSTTLATTSGGTGQTAYTDGQLLIGNSTGNTLTKATLTAGTGITITNGAGSITISAASTTGNVTFNSSTISTSTGYLSLDSALYPVLVNSTTDLGSGISANAFNFQVKGSSGRVYAALFKTELAGSAGYARPTLWVWNNDTTGDNNFVSFGTETSYTTRGSITYNRAGGSVAYNATSDYRSKDVYGPVTDSGSQLDALKVYRGKMHGATLERPVMIAHELATVAPYAVSGEKDAVNEDGSPKYQQVDFTMLVPLLIAEIQSLRARVATLEAK